jgi:hypothetical protein
VNFEKIDLAITSDIHLHGVFEEEGSTVDYVTLSQTFEDKFVAFKLSEDFASSMFYENKFCALIIDFQYYITVLILYVLERKYKTVNFDIA